MKRNQWSPIFNDPGGPSGVSPGILAIRSQFLHRFAFTLLETILALSLSALLLGAIYAAIEQSWRTASSGREEMERAQLARALIHKIEVDIRAITFVTPPAVEETETATATPTPTPTPAPKPPVPPNDKKKPPAPTPVATPTPVPTPATDTEPAVPNSKSMGIRGTTQKFEISIARPRRDLLPGTGTTASTTRTSDLRQVSYSFLPPGSSPSGLIRTEGDRMAVETLETSGGTGNQISSVQMVAPEVSAFHVRYFDGRIWSETWDTDKTGRIPRAIEVSIAFIPPRRKPPIFSVAVSRSMDSFRTVILIPVSDPYPQDFVK